MSLKTQDTSSDLVPPTGLVALDDEQWRKIPDYEGYYSVSNLGRVRSEPRVIDRPGPKGVLTVRGRILKQVPHYRDQYLMVSLNRDNIRRAFFVHRLVMLGFVGARPEGQEVRHLDCDKRNNTFANLCYGTPTENAQDSIRMGRTSGNACGARTHCPRQHQLVAPNLVAALLKRGKRSCLACNRALSATWKTRARYGFEIDVTAIADAYYAEIMAGADQRSA